MSLPANAQGRLRTTPAAVRVIDLVPGAIRSTPPGADRWAASNVNVVVPSLAVRAAASGGDEIVAIEPNKLVIGDRSTSLEDGALRIRWSRELSHGAIITDSDLAFGTVPEALLSGKTILAGTTDPARSTYYDTPVGRLPALLVHANALNTVMTNSPGRLVHFPAGVGLGFAVGALVAVVGSRRFRVALVMAAVWVVVAAVVVRVLSNDGTMIGPLSLTIAPIVAGVAMAVGQQLRAMAERRRLSRLFSEYVPAEVARTLVDSGTAERAAQGQRVSATAIFCDLRGFTPLSATITPSELRELLDVYYELLSQIVFDNGGTVLQYTGDEIYAVFGAPSPQSDHEARAVRCAVAFADATPVVNARLAALGLPPVSYGTGVNSGDVIAAHVGSSIRKQYSVFGDAVNVASRLCSFARENQVAISSATAAAAGAAVPFEVVAHPGVALKGKDLPMDVVVYTAVVPAGEFIDIVQGYV